MFWLTPGSKILLVSDSDPRNFEKIAVNSRLTNCMSDAMVALGMFAVAKAAYVRIPAAGDNKKAVAAIRREVKKVIDQIEIEPPEGPQKEPEAGPEVQPEHVGPGAPPYKPLIKPRSRKSTLPSPSKSASAFAPKKADFMTSRSAASTSSSSSRSGSQTFP